MIDNKDNEQTVGTEVPFTVDPQRLAENMELIREEYLDAQNPTRHMGEGIGESITSYDENHTSSVDETIGRVLTQSADNNKKKWYSGVETVTDVFAESIAENWQKSNIKIQQYAANAVNNSLSRAIDIDVNYENSTEYKIAKDSDDIRVREEAEKRAQLGRDTRQRLEILETYDGSKKKEQDLAILAMHRDAQQSALAGIGNENVRTAVGFTSGLVGGMFDYVETIKGIAMGSAIAATGGMLGATQGAIFAADLGLSMVDNYFTSGVENEIGVENLSQEERYKQAVIGGAFQFGMREAGKAASKHIRPTIDKIRDNYNLFPTKSWVDVTPDSNTPTVRLNPTEVRQNISDDMSELEPGSTKIIEKVIDNGADENGKFVHSIKDDSQINSDLGNMNPIKDETGEVIGYRADTRFKGNDVTIEMPSKLEFDENVDGSEISVVQMIEQAKKATVYISNEAGEKVPLTGTDKVNAVLNHWIGESSIKATQDIMVTKAKQASMEYNRKRTRKLVKGREDLPEIVKIGLGEIGTIKKVIRDNILYPLEQSAKKAKTEYAAHLGKVAGEYGGNLVRMAKSFEESEFARTWIYGDIPDGSDKAVHKLIRGYQKVGDFIFTDSIRKTVQHDAKSLVENFAKVFEFDENGNAVFREDFRTAFGADLDEAMIELSLNRHLGLEENSNLRKFGITGPEDVESILGVMFDGDMINGSIMKKVIDGATDPNVAKVLRDVGLDIKNEDGISSIKVTEFLEAVHKMGTLIGQSEDPTNIQKALSTLFDKENSPFSVKDADGKVVSKLSPADVILQQIDGMGTSYGAVRKAIKPIEKAVANSLKGIEKSISIAESTADLKDGIADIKTMNSVTSEILSDLLPDFGIRDLKGKSLTDVINGAIEADPEKAMKAFKTKRFKDNIQTLRDLNDKYDFLKDPTQLDLLDVDNMLDMEKTAVDARKTDISTFENEAKAKITEASSKIDESIDAKTEELKTLRDYEKGIYDEVLQEKTRAKVEEMEAGRESARDRKISEIESLEAQIKAMEAEGKVEVDETAVKSLEDQIASLQEELDNPYDTTEGGNTAKTELTAEDIKDIEVKARAEYDENVKAIQKENDALRKKYEKAVAKAEADHKKAMEKYEKKRVEQDVPTEISPETKAIIEKARKIYDRDVEKATALNKKLEDDYNNALLKNTMDELAGKPTKEIPEPKYIEIPEFDETRFYEAKDKTAVKNSKKKPKINDPAPVMKEVPEPAYKEIPEFNPDNYPHLTAEKLGITDEDALKFAKQLISEEFELDMTQKDYFNKYGDVDGVGQATDLLRRNQRATAERVANVFKEKYGNTLQEAFDNFVKKNPELEGITLKIVKEEGPASAGMGTVGGKYSFDKNEITLYENPADPNYVFSTLRHELEHAVDFKKRGYKGENWGMPFVSPHKSVEDAVRNIRKGHFSRGGYFELDYLINDTFRKIKDGRIPMVKKKSEAHKAQLSSWIKDLTEDLKNIKNPKTTTDKKAVGVIKRKLSLAKKELEGFDAKYDADIEKISGGLKSSRNKEVFEAVNAKKNEIKSQKSGIADDIKKYKDVKKQISNDLKNLMNDIKKAKTAEDYKALDVEGRINSIKEIAKSVGVEDLEIDPVQLGKAFEATDSATTAKNVSAKDVMKQAAEALRGVMEDARYVNDKSLMSRKAQIQAVKDAYKDVQVAMKTAGKKDFTSVYDQPEFIKALNKLQKVAERAGMGDSLDKLMPNELMGMHKDILKRSQENMEFGRIGRPKERVRRANRNQVGQTTMKMSRLGRMINKDIFLSDRGWFKLGDKVEGKPEIPYLMDSLEFKRDPKTGTINIGEFKYTDVINDENQGMFENLYSMTRDMFGEVIGEDGQMRPMNIDEFCVTYFDFLEDLGDTRADFNMWQKGKKSSLSSLIPYFRDEDTMIEFMTIENSATGRTGYVKSNMDMITDFLPSMAEQGSEYSAIGMSKRTLNGMLQSDQNAAFRDAVEGTSIDPAKSRFSSTQTAYIKEFRDNLNTALEPKRAAETGMLGKLFNGTMNMAYVAALGFRGAKEHLENTITIAAQRARLQGEGMGSALFAKEFVKELPSAMINTAKANVSIGIQALNNMRYIMPIIKNNMDIADKISKIENIKPKNKYMAKILENEINLLNSNRHLQLAKGQSKAAFYGENGVGWKKGVQIAKNIKDFASDTMMNLQSESDISKNIKSHETSYDAMRSLIDADNIQALPSQHLKSILQNLGINDAMFEKVKAFLAANLDENDGIDLDLYDIASMKNGRPAADQKMANTIGSIYTAIYGQAATLNKEAYFSTDNTSWSNKITGFLKTTVGGIAREEVFEAAYKLDDSGNYVARIANALDKDGSKKDRFIEAAKDFGSIATYLSTAAIAGGIVQTAAPIIITATGSPLKLKEKLAEQWGGLEPDEEKDNPNLYRAINGMAKFMLTGMQSHPAAGKFLSGGNLFGDKIKKFWDTISKNGTPKEADTIIGQYLQDIGLAESDEDGILKSIIFNSITKAFVNVVSPANHYSGVAELILSTATDSDFQYTKRLEKSRKNLNRKFDNENQRRAAQRAFTILTERTIRSTISDIGGSIVGLSEALLSSGQLDEKQYKEMRTNGLEAMGFEKEVYDKLPKKTKEYGDGILKVMGVSDRSDELDFKLAYSQGIASGKSPEDLGAQYLPGPSNGPNIAMRGEEALNSKQRDAYDGLKTDFKIVKSEALDLIAKSKDPEEAYDRAIREFPPKSKEAKEKVKTVTTFDTVYDTQAKAMDIINKNGRGIFNPTYLQQKGIYETPDKLSEDTKKKILMEDYYEPLKEFVKSEKHAEQLFPIALALGSDYINNIYKNQKEDIDKTLDYIYLARFEQRDMDGELYEMVENLKNKKKPEPIPDPEEDEEIQELTDKMIARDDIEAERLALKNSLSEATPENTGFIPQNELFGDMDMSEPTEEQLRMEPAYGDIESERLDLKNSLREATPENTGYIPQDEITYDEPVITTRETLDLDDPKYNDHATPENTGYIPQDEITYDEPADREQLDLEDPKYDDNATPENTNALEPEARRRFATFEKDIDMTQEVEATPENTGYIPQEEIPEPTKEEFATFEKEYKPKIEKVVEKEIEKIIPEVTKERLNLDEFVDIVQDELVVENPTPTQKEIKEKVTEVIKEVKDEVVAKESDNRVNTGEGKKATKEAIEPAKKVEEPAKPKETPVKTEEPKKAKPEAPKKVEKGPVKAEKPKENPETRKNRIIDDMIEHYRKVEGTGDKTGAAKTEEFGMTTALRKKLERELNRKLTAEQAARIYSERILKKIDEANPNFPENKVKTMISTFYNLGEGATEYSHWKKYLKNPTDSNFEGAMLRGATIGGKTSKGLISRRAIDYNATNPKDRIVEIEALKDGTAVYRFKSGKEVVNQKGLGHHSSSVSGKMKVR